jgi:hypothetical protein
MSRLQTMKKRLLRLETQFAREEQYLSIMPARIRARQIRQEGRKQEIALLRRELLDSALATPVSLSSLGVE